MEWSIKATVFNYCERDLDPGFWGEPLNALTNGAFVSIAVLALIRTLRLPRTQRSLWHFFFSFNFFAIGVGSFLFHTIPNRATGLADVIPIGIFMVSYLIFTLRHLLNRSRLITALGVFVFVLALGFAFRNRGLNGSVGYLPALLFMILIGASLVRKNQPAGRFLLLAGTNFSVSLIFRSVDQAYCDIWVVGGYVLGTHFLWHGLNAVTLWNLFRGALASNISR